MSLTSAQKQCLRGEAHKLKPVVIIGNQGLTPNVQAEIARALHDHKLIKVRINCETREERVELAQMICANLKADLIQTLGHIVVIYHPNLEFT